MQNKIISTSIVAFSTLALNYGSRGAFGLFLKPFATEFGSSRGAISSILSINMITYGGMAFFTGYLNDRFGPRIILLIGGLLAAVAYLLSSFAGGSAEIALSFGILFGVATCLLSQITALTLLIKFPLKVNSFLLGIVGSGPGIGNLVLIPSIGVILDYTGWRVGMKIIGLAFLGYLFLPLSLFHKNETLPFQNKFDASFGKVLFEKRNIALLSSAFLLMCVAIYGVLSQEAAYATDRGLSMSKAAWALSLVGGTGVIASPLLGWIAARTGSKKNLGASILTLAPLGIFFIFVSKSCPVLAIGSIIVGVTYSSYIPIFPSITRDLVGQDLFGRAWGIISMGGSIGAAIGSWLGGYLYDLQGNYNFFWMILAICLFAASISLFLVHVCVENNKGCAL